MRCVNFYGLESELKDFVCREQHDPSYYMEILSNELGVDTIRVPFSYRYVMEGNLSRLDSIVALKKYNIILDYHRTNEHKQSEYPEAEVTEGQFYFCWAYLLERYHADLNVKGVGIFNEIQNTNFTYANQFYHKFLDTFESRFPGRFTYYVGCLDWATNCTELNKVGTNNVQLEVHVYPFQKIPVILNETLFVGEIGWKVEEDSWAESILGSNPDLDICFWTISRSGDTGGLWKDDCMTKEQSKFDILKKYWKD